MKVSLQNIHNFTNNVENIRVLNSNKKKKENISFLSDFKNVNTNSIYNIAFHGLFSPSLQDKVDAGVLSVDNNTVFVATSNIKNSLFYLNRAVEKIDSPILRIYFLEDSNIKCPFAIFKNSNDKYLYMNLSVLGEFINIANQDVRVEPNEVKEVKDGVQIPQSIVAKNPLLINIPKYSSSKIADKVLQKYSTFQENEDVVRFNKSVLSGSFSMEKKAGLKLLTYDDVGGVDSVIKLLKERVICPIKYPQIFENLRLNKGIILYGPPRCGKTLVGLATANEVNANFVYINANEMTDSLVGKSEENWRNLFAQARAKQPCILFIDEIDSVAKKRQGGESSRYQDTVVNQLLGLMSDLEKSNDNVFVIAATNRKDLLDNAITDTGRFGLHIRVDLPDIDGIAQIFKIHARNQPIDQDIDTKKLFELMYSEKFSGSDVAEVITNAYHKSLENNHLYEKMLDDTISIEDINNIHITNDDLFAATKDLIMQKSSDN